MKLFHLRLYVNMCQHAVGHQPVDAESHQHILSASSIAATDSVVLDTGLLPINTSPTANENAANTWKRISSRLSVGELG